MGLGPNIISYPGSARDPEVLLEILTLVRIVQLLSGSLTLGFKGFVRIYGVDSFYVHLMLVVLGATQILPGTILQRLVSARELPQFVGFRVAVVRRQVHVIQRVVPHTVSQACESVSIVLIRPASADVHEVQCVIYTHVASLRR